MARNQAAQLEVESFPDPREGAPPHAAAPPPPSRRTRAKTAPGRWRGRLRLGVLIIALAAAGLLAALGLYQIDQFLAGDPRFALPGSAQDPWDTPCFRIEGTANISRAEVARVFAGDFGRSVYLLPLSERRRELMSIDWVRDASVSRRWPNRVAVRVIERTPVAFVALPPSGTVVGPAPVPHEMALIDSEGVILRLPPRGSFALPVLFGISRRQTHAARRERVGRMLQLMEELEAYSRHISEIDVADPNSLKVTQSVEGRAVRLLLGNRNFLSRVENFLQHYPEISRRLPYAVTFDLRLDDRITAVEEPADGR